MSWGKKISELFWEIRPGSPPTFNKTAENRTFVVSGRNFFIRHRTRKLISGGFRAYLGREKTFLQFWKIRPGRPPTTKSKIGHQKFATSRPHREPGNRPRAQTLLFLKKARPSLFKMSGGLVCPRVICQELCSKNEIGHYFRAGLYILYAYIFTHTLPTIFN